MIQSNSFDVIVVGAGPAGSSAAYELARSGKSVLIIEKDREVGRNVLCAEGISKNFFEIVKPEKGVATKITRIGIHIEDKVGFYVHSSSVFGYVLERKIFDRHLFERAVSSGAEPFLGARFVDLSKEDEIYKVTVQYKEERVSFFAPAVIGADGPGSGVGLRAGFELERSNLLTHYCAQVYLYHPAIDAETIEFYYSRILTPGGYAWVFPKDKGFANVGLGVTSGFKEAEENLRSFLNRYFPGGRVCGFLRGVVPSGGLDLKLEKDNVFLVGDAGRLADPMSGGGIANAYLSGKLAAESILSGNSIKYQQLLEKKLKKDYLISKTVRDVFYNLDESELTSIFAEIKNSIGGKNLEEVNPLSALKILLKVSPSAFSHLLKRGGKFFHEFIREIVS
ncbi:MAG: NAD(P)/FAD-dependent oxidoreductase [candidate division WOR-3 bacterium]